MRKDHFTAHAESRLQQRNIPPCVVDWVLEFGRMRRCRGADVYALDKRGRRMLRSYLGREHYGRIEGRLGIYVVQASDGRIVTVARRLSRPRLN